MNEYGTGAVRLAFTFVRNIADAEDIAQDAFLAFIEKAPPFQDEDHEKAWLIRVVMNKCKDFLKSGWKKHTVPMPDDLAYMPSDNRMLLQTVLDLDEKYRLPVYLFYFDDLSIKETAAILGASPSTIGTRLERGRNLIRQKLGEDIHE